MTFQLLWYIYNLWYFGIGNFIFDLKLHDCYSSGFCTFIMWFLPWILLADFIWIVFGKLIYLLLYFKYYYKFYSCSKVKGHMKSCIVLVNAYLDISAKFLILECLTDLRRHSILSTSFCLYISLTYLCLCDPVIE